MGVRVLESGDESRAWLVKTLIQRDSVGEEAGQPPSQEQINIGSPWKRPGQTGWLAAAAAAGCAL